MIWISCKIIGHANHNPYVVLNQMKGYCSDIVYSTLLPSGQLIELHCASRMKLSKSNTNSPIKWLQTHVTSTISIITQIDSRTASPT
jgi:hypothetical protein